MSVAAASTGLALARRRHRRRRVLIEAGSVMLAVILLIWSLIPVYNMFLIALDPEEGEVEFTGNIWPPEPSLDAFGVVLTQADRYLEHFWQQFGNSLFIGLMTMLLTVLIGSLAGFAASRMRLGKGSLITNTALVTYVLPAAFLTIPFYLVVHSYGLSNDPWGVIAAQVTFATPFAILILRHYASLIPSELDDAARIGRRIQHSGVFPYLSAVDHASAGGRRDLRPGAGLERLFLPVCAAHHAEPNDGGDDAGPYVRRSRRGVERDDGRRDHLFAAADCDLFRPSPIYGGGSDYGWLKGHDAVARSMG